MSVVRMLFVGVLAATAAGAVAVAAALRSGELVNMSCLPRSFVQSRTKSDPSFLVPLCRWNHRPFRALAGFLSIHLFGIAASRLGIVAAKGASNSVCRP